MCSCARSDDPVQLGFLKGVLTWDFFLKLGSCSYRLICTAQSLWVNIAGPLSWRQTLLDELH